MLVTDRGLVRVLYTICHHMERGREGGGKCHRWNGRGRRGNMDGKAEGGREEREGKECGGDTGQYTQHEVIAAKYDQKSYNSC